MYLSNISRRFPHNSKKSSLSSDIFGNCDYQCHQGGDRNITKKQKYKETRKDLVRRVGHAQHIKTKK